MKKRLPSFLSGVLVTVLAFSLGLSALAASGKLTLEVEPVNIQVNGVLFKPKDVKGNDVPVFAYNGTTYAPLRALAEAYGLTVGYNSAANMATVDASAALTPVEPLEPVPDAPRAQTVRVATVAELVSAIAPNTEIILAPGEYDLTNAAKKSDSPYVSWLETSDGYELNIMGVQGLTIRGEGSGDTSIVTASHAASVLQFYSCTDVVLTGFTAGHLESGFCVGVVLGFDDCAGVRITACSLYGCGAYGVYSYDSSHFTVADTEIYGCSSGAVGVFNSSALTFDGCTFHDNGSTDLLSVWSSRQVLFSNCLMRDNRVPADYLYETMLLSLEEAEAVAVRDCVIRGNEYGQFYSIYLTGEGPAVENCQFENNSFAPPV